MKNSKSSRLDLLDKKIKQITNVLDKMINEIEYAKTMSVGTYSIVKNLKEYEIIIQKLKDEQEGTDTE
jgi:hypothetical protein